MKTKLRKKALTSQTIIILIVIIVSAVILLFFMWQIGWKETIDKEACHNSVIMKATTPTIAGRKILPLPLRCKTEKICLTMGGKGECLSSTGVEIYGTEKIKVKNAEDINREIAKKLYDCWWMMGEGKVSIFEREFSLGEKYKLRGVICFEIYFDTEIKNKYNENEPIKGLVSYLQNHEVPHKEGITYWYFLSGTYSTIISTASGDKRDAYEVQEIDSILPEDMIIMFIEAARTTAIEDGFRVLGGIIGGVLGSKVKLGFVGGLGGAILAGNPGEAVANWAIGEPYWHSLLLVPYNFKAIEELQNKQEISFENIPSS